MPKTEPAPKPVPNSFTLPGMGQAKVKVTRSTDTLENWYIFELRGDMYNAIRVHFSESQMKAFAEKVTALTSAKEAGKEFIVAGDND